MAERQMELGGSAVSPEVQGAGERGQWAPTQGCGEGRMGVFCNCLCCASDHVWLPEAQEGAEGDKLALEVRGNKGEVIFETLCQPLPFLGALCNWPCMCAGALKDLVWVFHRAARAADVYERTVCGMRFRERYEGVRGMQMNMVPAYTTVDGKGNVSTHGPFIQVWLCLGDSDQAAAQTDARIEIFKHPYTLGLCERFCSCCPDFDEDSYRGGEGHKIVAARTEVFQRLNGFWPWSTDGQMASAGVLAGGQYQWQCGHLFNGYIYSLPCYARAALRIDPRNGVVRAVGHMTGEGHYAGMVATADGGELIGVPCNTDRVVRLNLAMEEVSEFGHGLPAQARKWTGGAVCPANGMIYCAPRDYEQILRIDPANETTAFVEHEPLPGKCKYTDMVLGSTPGDGGESDLLFGIPHQASAVLRLEVNRTTGTETVTLFGDNPVGDEKWTGGAFCPANNAIYCAPYNAPVVLKINTLTSELQSVGSFPAGGQKWCRGCLGPDGCVYFAPHTARTILRVDPNTDQCFLINLPDTVPVTTEAYAGACVSGNAIYFSPCSAASVLVFDVAAQAVGMIVSDEAEPATVAVVTQPGL